MARRKQCYNSFTEQTIQLELSEPGYYHLVLECFDEDFSVELRGLVSVIRKEMSMDIFLKKQRICTVFPELCPKRLEFLMDTVNRWLVIANAETKQPVHRVDWNSTQEIYWLDFEAPHQPFGFKLYKDIPMVGWQHEPAKFDELQPSAPRKKVHAKKRDLMVR